MSPTSGVTDVEVSPDPKAVDKTEEDEPETFDLMLAFTAISLFDIRPVA